MDSETDLVREHAAVVYAPRRRRGRFPENCVALFPSEQVAIAAADACRQRYPARVVGPSRSSEGARLYYLVLWLD
ncbi:MAG TPA: hypothetical protein DEP05_04070 [Betaproteobacteria bacterium]|nr:hypothetical protein [Betaproteobacteria bacterium]